MPLVTLLVGGVNLGVWSLKLKPTQDQSLLHLFFRSPDNLDFEIILGVRQGHMSLGSHCHKGKVT